MEPKTISIFLILIAAALLVTGLIMAAGTSGNGGFSIKNGKAVTCNVNVGVVPIVGKFYLASGQCNGGEACIVNPLKTLTIFDVNGNLRLTADGKTFASQDIVKNQLSVPSSFSLNACVPQDATAIHVQVLNDQGGVDDDREVKLT